MDITSRPGCAQRSETRSLYWSPVGQCMLLVLPMMSFSVVLMVLVYVYDWQRHHLPIAGLSLESGLYTDVYYVDLPATRLITVASWSSSVVITFVGSFMTLLSYATATELIWSSRSAFTGMLPNSSQLALLVDLLDGKKMAMVLWFVTMWKRGRRQSRSVWAVEVAVALQALTVTLCIAIAGVDTWLHLSTESVSMPYLQSVDPMQAGATYQYSRNLLPGCWNTNSQDLPCSISESTESEIDYQLEINDLLLNETSAMTNLYVDHDSRYVYLGPPTIEAKTTSSSVAPVQYPQFNASTFAMNTLCSLVECNLSANAGSPTFSFSCPGGFAQNATKSWFETGPWFQSPGDNYTGYSGLWDRYGSDTGLQWGVFIHLDDFKFTSGTFNHSLTSDEPSVTFMMQCSSTIGPTEYAWANNSLSGSLSPSSANQTLFNITLGPFLSQGRILTFPNLQVFRNRLDIQRNDTVSRVATKVQTLISGIGLSFLAANIATGPAINLQLPGTTIVTQVPKLPLFALVALNLWYAVLAVCLCILACFLLSRGESGKDIIAVRELLSVTGLAKAAVSNHRSVQGEDTRIGVVKRDGEWHFKVWPASGDDRSEAEGLLEHEKDNTDTDIARSINRNSDNPTPSIKSIRTVATETESMLPDGPGNERGHDPVSPISPASYRDIFLSSDQEERRRVSRSLEWADSYQ